MYKATDVEMAILVWVYFQKLLSMQIWQYIKNKIEGKNYHTFYTKATKSYLIRHTFCSCCLPFLRLIPHILAQLLFFFFFFFFEKNCFAVFKSSVSYFNLRWYLILAFYFWRILINFCLPLTKIAFSLKKWNTKTRLLACYAA